MQTKHKKILEGKTEEQVNHLISMTLEEQSELLYNIQKHHPFYSAILGKMLKEIDFEIPVAAVTFRKASPLLLTNPFGMGSYLNKEKVFIYIHEINHIVNQHHLRGRDKDPGVWNIATDVAINQMIESKIAYRPIDCLMPHHFNLPERLSPEQYYDILMARDEPITLPESLANSLLQDLLEGDDEGDGGEGDGDGKGKDGDDDGDGNGQGKPGQGKPGKGSGQGKPEKSKKAPGFEKLHPNWKEVQDMSEDMVKGLTKGMVQEAINKSAGDVPGELSEGISELFEPQVQWDRILRSFATSVLSTKRRSTWARPSRRFGSVKMGALREKEAHFLVAIDTSGSLSTDELTMFLSEIKSLKESSNADITIVQCDTHIHEVIDFDKVDIHNFEVKGRGGTDLQPPFELAEKRSKHGHKLTESVDGIIYLTDGYGQAPEKCSIRTLWVISPGGRVPYSSNHEDVDWGQSVFLNDGKDLKK